MTTNQEYNETKESFRLLNKIAKELKLNDIGENVNPECDEPEVFGQVSGHPKAKEGWSFEVSVKEVHDHKDTTGGNND